MPSKKETFILTISPKYVPAWSKWEAFRELMQNVIDRKNEFEPAEIVYKYDSIQQRIIIGNKLSSLSRSTLILGETSKTGNRDLIGQYGEGYKLAILVFLRLGVRVRVRTGNEIWAPAIKYSDQFETDVIVIEVIKTGMYTDTLMFELDGITDNDYSVFSLNCLYLSPALNKISTSMGDILLDESMRGKIFVEGLFVCSFFEKEKIRYGYNMKARYLELDRDRRKVSTFNLTWELGRMYNLLDSTYAGFIFNLQKEEWKDCEYYNQHRVSENSSLYQALCTLHHDEFLAKYGKAAIPVQTEAEALFIKEKYNDLVPVVTPYVIYKFITASNTYQSSTKRNVKTEETPYSIVEKTVKKVLRGKEYDKIREKLLNTLLPLAREWRRR